MKIIDKHIKVVSRKYFYDIVARSLNVNKIYTITNPSLSPVVEIEYDKSIAPSLLDSHIRDLYFYAITLFLVIYYRIVPDGWSLFILGLIAINILWRKQIYYWR